MNTLVDSGSECTIIHKILANAVVMSSKNSYWVQVSVMHDLKTFWNDIIKIVGIAIITENGNDGTAIDVKVTVVED